MARNLMKNGYEVVAFDVATESTNKLATEGATIAQSPKEVAQQARKIISMVPASAHVREVYTGSNGVLQAAQAGDLYVDASTIDPHVAKELSSIVKSHGASFIDAPVSGGVTGAANGTLSFMVGAEPEALEQARPLLEAMGKRIIHCGANGTGQIAKVYLRYNQIFLDQFSGKF
jgi:3-hydroxyisobutyrate dehydrogenase-like beta-hydroxyacid dehydrogenase